MALASLIGREVCRRAGYRHDQLNYSVIGLVMVNYSTVAVARVDGLRVNVITCGSLVNC